MNTILISLATISTILLSSHLLDINDKLLFNLYKTKLDSIDSSEFEIVQKTILKIEKNLSGISYSDNTDTLFAITNSPRNIYELSKDGTILRTIELSGFRDTEDLVYIKDELFAILDEGLSAFYIVKIDANTRNIDIKDSLNSFVIDVANFENFGLEGIAYNQNRDIFYVANERMPKKVIEIKGLFSNEVVTTKNNSNLAKNNHFLGDLSALHYDKYSDKLYILSDESRLLAKSDSKINKFEKYLDLDNFSSLKSMRNPEGFTKDKYGNFYVVGEPNIFFSLRKIQK